jgi:hypothetical protein
MSIRASIIQKIDRWQDALQQGILWPKYPDDEKTAHLDDAEPRASEGNILVLSPLMQPGLQNGCCRLGDPDVDLLVATAFHNLNHSPLCRLPEEVLLEIMKLLDPLSIQCIRRACRLFLRLYDSPEFSGSHASYLHQSQFLPWNNPVSSFWKPVARLQPLLERDTTGYCSDCQKKRMSRSWTRDLDGLTKRYMSCSGCGSEHPAGLFSAVQRRWKRPFDRHRLCIGHEGHLRICDHLTLKWREIESTAKRLLDLDVDREARILHRVCGSASHIPAHHGFDSSHTLNQNIHPVVSLVRRGPPRRGCIEVEVEWDGHMDLGPALQRHGQITPAILRQELDSFRQGTAEFLAPEIPPGRLAEMSCFDPNRCGCLAYPGQDKLSHRWQLAPLERIWQPTCRAQPTRHLLCWGTYSGHEKGGAATKQPQTNGHLTRVVLLQRFADGQSTIDVEANQCSSGKSCLRMIYRRSITVIPLGHEPGLVSRGWFQALDPDSYLLREDLESFGVLWCSHEGCRNYYRYIKKALAPVNCTHREG